MCASVSQRIQPHKRKRCVGGSKQFANEVIRDELFAFFVDSINNVHGRIPSFVMLAQAAVIGEDYKRGIQIKIANGELDPAFPIVIPKFTHQWLLLWRRAYGLSWRTCNLRFKVSFLKLKELTCIFWCNTLRIRWIRVGTHLGSLYPGSRTDFGLGFVELIPPRGAEQNSPPLWRWGFLGPGGWVSGTSHTCPLIIAPQTLSKNCPIIAQQSSCNTVPKTCPI